MVHLVGKADVHACMERTELLQSSSAFSILGFQPRSGSRSRRPERSAGIATQGQRKELRRRRCVREEAAEPTASLIGGPLEDSLLVRKPVLVRSKTSFSRASSSYDMVPIFCRSDAEASAQVPRAVITTRSIQMKYASLRWVSCCYPVLLNASAQNPTRSRDSRPTLPWKTPSYPY